MVLIHHIVWQIAQRDYKFGKGKHRSLTPATYTAIANYFRALWGKEAGWAHSVLFTADLKAFSERLVAKVEVKEEEIVVKEEPDGGENVEMISRTRTALKKKIKRVNDSDEDDMVDVKKKVVKRRKRL